MSGVLDYIYDSEIFVDLYSILEIDMDAKVDEIKTSYLKLAKKNHPDQGGSSEIFQQITRAYEILYNKETRKEYDLYYLKKSMDEFKGDDMIRLRDDYKNFTEANSKPISKEELDKLYADTFDGYKDKFVDEKVDEHEFINRITDIKLERENMNIETYDDTLDNFIKEHKDNVNVNDLFEYLKYKNSNSFSNTIIKSQLGTLDTLPGYSNGFSSFVDDNEYFGSNLYSNISDINSISVKENINKLNIDDFIQWKNIKVQDTKLTPSDVDYYLKKRQEEQETIFKEVDKNISNSSKRKEVEKFLKTKHLTEDLDGYYDNLNEITSKTNDSDNNNDISTNTKTKNKSKIISIETVNKIGSPQSSNLDDMLNYMDQIRSEEFPINDTKKIDQISEQDDFTELKSNREVPKINNVRKREFK